MTDTTETLRIPIAHSVRYAARGLPEVPNQYGPGVLAPSEITLTYRAAPDSQLGRVHAYVAGRLWVDGVETPLLPGGLYGQHYDDGLDGWPVWLAEEARLHDPAASVVVPAADRAAPCRTTQHCAHHGFCHRCAPAFAAVMSRVNVAIQRTDPEEGHWGPLYEAVAKVLREEARECTASISGNCLREGQSEGACDTDGGECVYSGRPAEDVAHPSHDSWIVELLMTDGHWAAAFPTHDREAALERLARNLTRTPDRQWRLVQLREAYTVVLTCPRCGEDLTTYEEDDYVYLKDDTRPYCSGECVIGMWRAQNTTDEEATCTNEQPGPAVEVQPGKDTETPQHAPGTAVLCPDCRAKGHAVCMADKARIVGYSGKGRLWCLTCPCPDREDVPMTIGLVCVGELCAGCGRDVVDVARATEQQPKEG
ncbi:hypothetical protein PV382_18035 [Streptomyces scabiei]|uniref:hypothetical protein n=1 Tax=Streptomyces scabiei TaxID=1930 RepID=UPI000765C8AB|nr:hypothetical protein [Streptomyces scabiei]MDX3174177.1 hypothetical protein [Streptomyces scabiei]